MAPSLSGATGGSLSEVGMRAFRPAKSAHAIANAGLRSALPSPFLAAAHLGHVGGVRVLSRHIRLPYFS